MRISYVTTYDASDVRQWSGTGYYIAKALENQKAEIDYVKDQTFQNNYYNRVKSRVYRVFGKKFLTDRSPELAKKIAANLETKIKDNTDVVFSPGSIPIAFLRTNKPKVIYTDATFGGILNFYNGFTNVCSESIKHGNLIEQQSLDSCALAIFSSDWAAKSAIDHYNISSDKIKVVPFGANIECSRTFEDIKNLVNNKSKKECNLLFLGVDWERKGGNLALEVAEILNERGLPTKLHIVGPKTLPLKNKPDYIVNHGFISKSSIEGNNKINGLISDSHFLLLPSRADCTPIVLSEVNSFGVPCISTDVGGIQSIIKDDINGKTFSLNSQAQAYANYIENTFSNSKTYSDLALSSFNEYETRLNWNVTGKTIMSLLRGL